MAERALVQLDRLLPALSARARVATAAGGDVSGPALLTRVAAWYAMLDFAPGSSIALAHGDALEFVAALYAAWLRQLEVVVAADTLPATIEQLAPQVVALTGEFGPATTLATPGPCATTLAQDLPLGLASTLILSTSGSTGAPLRVVKRLAQLDAEVDALEQCFGDRLGDCAIAATVSHQHIYGLLFRLLWPLASGRPFEPHKHAYLETVAPRLQAGPLALVASPAHLKRIPAGLDWNPQGRRLHAVFSSGGPLPLDAALAATAALGQAPIEVYGSTETGGIGWRQQRAADTPFQALPGVDIDPQEDARLRVRSPHLSARDWLLLADRGVVASDGRLHLLGRDDRIVKVEEKRVSLNAIEAAARAGSWVTDARAMLLDGPRASIGLVAIPNDAARELLLTQGRRALAERVRTELKSSCERVALPRRFRFLAAWPQDAQGKTSAARLQALFQQTESRLPLPFYDWLQRGPTQAQAELLISPDLYHFQGHFPEQPILPGVVQIDWAIALARSIYTLPSQLHRMEALKFQALIQPGMRLLVDLAWQAERATLEFRAHSAAGAHASARLVFG